MSLILTAPPHHSGWSIFKDISLKNESTAYGRLFSRDLRARLMRWFRLLYFIYHNAETFNLNTNKLHTHTQYHLFVPVPNTFSLINMPCALTDVHKISYRENARRTESFSCCFNFVSYVCGVSYKSTYLSM